MGSTDPMDDFIPLSTVTFTPTLRTGPTPTTDPSAPVNRLSRPFSVCILGASRGIGAAIAISYAEAGASHLVLTARTSEALAGVKEQIARIAPDAAVVPLACNSGSPEAHERLVQTIEQKVPDGRLDAVIVNAAYYGPDVSTDITTLSPVEWSRAIDVNLTGTYLAAHYLIPLLLKTTNGARVFLGVSSLGAWITRGPIAHTPYCVSKFAQVRVLEHVAEQYGPKDRGGILSISIHPGAVKTDMSVACPPSFEDCEFFQESNLVFHLSSIWPMVFVSLAASRDP